GGPFSSKWTAKASTTTTTTTGKGSVRTLERDFGASTYSCPPTSCSARVASSRRRSRAGASRPSPVASPQRIPFPSAVSTILAGGGASTARSAPACSGVIATPLRLSRAGSWIYLPARGPGDEPFVGGGRKELGQQTVAV